MCRHFTARRSLFNGDCILVIQVYWAIRTDSILLSRATSYYGMQRNRPSIFVYWSFGFDSTCIPIIKNSSLSQTYWTLTDSLPVLFACYCVSSGQWIDSTRFPTLLLYYCQKITILRVSLWVRTYDWRFVYHVIWGLCSVLSFKLLVRYDSCCL